jgi:hypothetical protein
MSRLAIAAAALLAGCYGADTLEWEVVDDVVGGGGKADGAGPLVIDTELGASFAELSVQALGPGLSPSPETLRDSAVVLRFQVEAGTTFAAATRAQSPELDPVLVLHSDTTSTYSRDQAYLPMGAPRDALIVHTAEADETYVLIATSVDYASAGEFHLDLVALPEDPGVELWGGRGPELVSASLREREPEVGAYVAAEVYIEDGSGSLDHGPAWAELPLRERHDANLLMLATNRERLALFEHAVLAYRGYDPRPTPDEVARVGRVLGALWAAVR